MHFVRTDEPALHRPLIGDHHGRSRSVVSREFIPETLVAQTMNRSHLDDVVRTYYHRVDADDIDGMMLLFEPDSIYDRPGQESIVGRSAIAEFYRSQPAIRSRRHSITSLIVEGFEVAVHGTADRTTLDGQHSTIGFADFFTVSGTGRFAYRRTFFFVPFA
ncbi:nuclear transport factor 2 family protein [Micromonospora sp. WMMD1120]|uniref:nuclear transport factor 2 family protein n=1 Tax=Micromonospora sp. WMMD1120 TaxID=3016106 RepID=UPI0024164BC8|nr:nuclear transport factor 2 family protein [Micromonospora sp. WMMD1120]MDG4809348.1 nuclear transport factor 2 family protein [Micromonospora sp. WMMD1120]